MNKWNLDGVSVDVNDNVTIGNNLAVGGNQTNSGSVTVGSGDTAISATDGALYVNSGATFQAGGTVIFDALPTSDPEVVGQLWNSSGTVKVSAGPAE